MNDYYDLEKAVLSCLLDEPNLMEKVTLEDKHFIKYQRVWRFMKSYYSKFKTFDLISMKNLCEDKSKNELVNFIAKIIDSEARYVRFDLYQKQLKELFDEKKHDKMLIETIYDLATDLYVRKISLDDFNKALKELGVDENE